MKKTVAILLILVFRLTHAAAPTNFIQILTDDQGWGDLAAFGHLQLKTPYIDNNVLRDGHDWWKRGSWKKNFPTEIANEAQ